jgi:hypothetical protein
MSQCVIFPAPGAGGSPRDFGWEFDTDYRVALKIKNGSACPDTPAQALGPRIAREVLDRRLAAGEESPTAPYFYSRTENYNRSDPRELDFDAWYGPAPASGNECWGATGWCKALPERPVVEILPNGVLLGCAWCGDSEGCRFALTHGADPNFRDGSTSVLSAAIEGRSIEVVELLIAAGLRSDQGRDVAWLIHPLVENGERALLERLLIFLRAPEDQWSRLLGVSADVATAELLEAHGATVQRAVAAGWLPLHEILKLNDRRPRPERLDRAAEIVSWLVSRGADPNAVEAHAGTALDLAVWHWEVPAIRALLANGANPRLVSNGRSPAQVADQKGQLAAFHALVEEWSKEGSSPEPFADQVPDVAASDPSSASTGRAAAGPATGAPHRKRALFDWFRAR